MPPNPSVKGTCPGQAPYVERQVASSQLNCQYDYGVTIL